MAFTFLLSDIILRKDIGMALKRNVQKKEKTAVGNYGKFLEDTFTPPNVLVLFPKLNQTNA